MAWGVSGYAGRPSCTRQRKQGFGTTDARRCTPMHRAVGRSGAFVVLTLDVDGRRPDPPSWPGLTRPSAPGRWCVDGRVEPGHDGEVGLGAAHTPFARTL